ESNAGCAECADRSARESREQQQHRNCQFSLSTAAASAKLHRDEKHRKMQGNYKMPSRRSTHAEKEHPEAQAAGEKRDQHIGSARLQRRSDYFSLRFACGIKLGHCRVIERLDLARE